jgi:hypothetical protein
MNSTNQNQVKKPGSSRVYNKRHPFIKNLAKSGISLKLLADHSPIPYKRVQRIVTYGWSPRDEEVAALRSAVIAIFKSLITLKDFDVRPFDREITTR